MAVRGIFIEKLDLNDQNFCHQWHIYKFLLRKMAKFPAEFLNLIIVQEINQNDQQIPERVHFFELG